MKYPNNERLGSHGIRETCQTEHHTDTQEQAKHPQNIEKNSIPIKILCGSQQTVENSYQRWEYQTTLSVSWETCMQVKKQQLEPDMEQWTSSKWGRAYIKAVYCHPAYLTYMQSTSCEMPGWMKHKLESRLPGDRISEIKAKINK